MIDAKKMEEIVKLAHIVNANAEQVAWEERMDGACATQEGTDDLDKSTKALILACVRAFVEQANPWQLYDEGVDAIARSIGLLDEKEDKG